MNRPGYVLRGAALLGALAVALGAFGAHVLGGRLSAGMLDVFEVGVRYHFYHALAMFALAAGTDRLWATRWGLAAWWAWLTGIVLFSGSLYLLAFTGITGLGAITPLGGAAFIAGWAALLPAAGRAARTAD